MLRTTIQTLEVQRATIATLKGISGAMLAPITKPGQKAEGGVPMPSFPLPPPEQAPEPVSQARKSSHKRDKAKAAAHPPTVTEAPLNPTAWWNTLQDQFTKIAATAAAGAAPAPARKPATSAGTKRAGKTGKAS